MSNRRRQRHCFAPGCRTGYEWGKKQPSLFSVPKDEELRKVWERNLRRKDKRLDETCSVCELHFEPSLVRHDFVYIINGEEVRMPRKRAELLPGAVPTLLPNVPSHRSKKASQPRPPGKRKNADAKKMPSTVSANACSSTIPAAADSVLSTDAPDTGALDEAGLPPEYSTLCVPSEC
ncbi:uncharacterized protein LOC115309067 [Ixodes scapularis]|uniref:uncharacterized protein LOC115309067 n=1 Tax=Ixodes scapularis TaxID=6945 RepID=UPI001A9EE059|nr:uncharacterized protein LOC115309067 [Ixodes scapularis]